MASLNDGIKLFEWLLSMYEYTVEETLADNVLIIYDRQLDTVITMSLFDLIDDFIEDIKTRVWYDNCTEVSNRAKSDIEKLQQLKMYALNHEVYEPYNYEVAVW